MQFSDGSIRKMMPGPAGPFLVYSTFICYYGSQETGNTRIAFIDALPGVVLIVLMDMH